MTKSNSFLPIVLILLVSSFMISSCYDDTPVTELNLGFNKDTPDHFYEGTWDMVEVRVWCTSPNVVSIAAEKAGKCVRDYCHTGSVLEIKQIQIPGTFDYTVDPPAPIVASGEQKYFENYDEFYSEWGFANGNLATFIPIGMQIGTSCWLIMEWKKQ